MSCNFDGYCIDSIDCIQIDIFTILLLPTYEHGRSFHLLRHSSISFFRDLKFLSCRSFTCLVRVTLRYFILFVAIVKGVVSLFFLSLFVICIKEGYWFVWVNFIFSHFSEVVYQLEKFSGRVFGVAYESYHIMCKY